MSINETNDSNYYNHSLKQTLVTHKREALVDTLGAEAGMKAGRDVFFR